MYICIYVIKTNYICHFSVKHLYLLLLKCSINKLTGSDLNNHLMNFLSNLPRAGLKAGDSIHSTGSQSSPRPGLEPEPGEGGRPGRQIPRLDSPLSKSDIKR